MNQNKKKYGLFIDRDRKVVTPSMFSHLVFMTRGGYMWMSKAGTENTWMSNGWQGECSFERMLELYGPVAIVNPDGENFGDLPIITKDGYIVEPNPE